MEIHNGTYTVYIHTNKINGKMYVGITKRKPEERWGHGASYKGNPVFYGAIKKYGWDGFYHDIYASNLTMEQAMNMEKLLIKQFKTQDRCFGYNITGGGDTPITHNEYVRKKISQSVSGEKHPCYGKHLSEQTRKKISESQKGKKITYSEKFQKKVICIQTGEIYNSVKQAAQKCGLKRPSLSQVLTGSRNSIHGLHWAYYQLQ